MTCWDCKYHKPVSVAFSFCKLKKRGISFMDLPKGCPYFRCDVASKAIVKRGKPEDATACTVARARAKESGESEVSE